MTPIVIVGCGAASYLLLLMFSAEGIPPHHITVIDPYFDGGDLQREWCAINSNTHWKKLCDAIQLLYPAWKNISGKWQLTATAPLSAIIGELRTTVAPYLQKCVMISDTATSATYTESWEIFCAKSNQRIKSEILFLCTGSKPKSLTLPIPTIPLSKALSPESLRAYIEPNHKVIVFGLQHSGTLVLDSLLKAGCSYISAIHRQNSEIPFLFARDGNYDGIKEESEIIADRLLLEKPSTLEFIHQSDFERVARALRTADWVIYAIGFTAREECRVVSGGSSIQLDQYDATTGKLPAVGAAWGFGIAFPNRAPDGKHYDVSIHSFAQHILNQKAEIMEKYRSVTSAKITNT